MVAETFLKFFSTHPLLRNVIPYKCEHPPNPELKKLEAPASKISQQKMKVENSIKSFFNCQCHDGRQILAFDQR